MSETRPADAGCPTISEESARAYRIVLAAALYHMRRDLACVLGGMSWWRPMLLRNQLRAVCVSAYRAYAFHNLAIYAARDFRGFREDYFWETIDWFHAECPKVGDRYRELFDFALTGKSVDIVAFSFGDVLREPRAL